jgi:hypothetical protein
MDKTKKKATKKGAADGNDLNGPVRWFEVNNGLHFVRIARSRIKERSDESQQLLHTTYGLLACRSHFYGAQKYLC